MTNAEYQAYLHSPEWRTRRIAVLRRADHRCEVCYSKRRLEVHHKTYDRLGAELESDLIVLCENCHGRFHDKLPDNPAAPLLQRIQKACLGHIGDREGAFQRARDILSREPDSQERANAVAYVAWVLDLPIPYLPRGSYYLAETIDTS